ncbi:PIG-L deacetylase family protein [Alienimonas sp. DA493]|uniref:PIG-L deacetylase family protein n=1 Tax=Alienimonas sp. DA493 TaxID=3373605 RepID=UPI003754DAC5
MFHPSLTGLREVLCLGAHSDDIEIGCGGTLLRLVAANPGLRITWIVFSGADDEVRRAEALRGAERFCAGAPEPTVHVEGFRDGYFPFDPSLKDRFRTLAAATDPDLIFTHRRDDAHQDHRALADLTWQHFRNHLTLEYEIPKYEGDLGRPNLFVPLDAATAERKVGLLTETFVSQRTRRWFTPETFEATLRLRGIESNAGSGFAEGFHVRKIVL